MPDFTDEQEAEIAAALHAYQAGDRRDAIGVLWTHLNDRLREFVRGQLQAHPPHFDADDILMEVFSKLCRPEPTGALDNVLTAQRALAVLMHMCRTVLIDRHRETARSRRRNVGIVDAETHAEPDRDLDDGERQQQLSRIMDELPPEKRQVLTLARLGMTKKAIATELNLTVEAVAVRMVRAHRAFRQIAESLGWDVSSLLFAKPVPPTNPKGERHRPLPAPVADEPIRDPVDCTVFAPPSARAGDSLLVQVMAHRPEQAAAAAESAREIDADARRRGQTSLETDVERGSRLVFRLALPGLAIPVPIKHSRWTGEPGGASFMVEVPADHPVKAIFGTLTVCQDDVPLGQIAFKLDVHAVGGPVASPAVATGEATAFEQFFISYATPDRPEVLKRVQMLRRLGKRFFQDVLHLDPGDRWERNLYRHIDTSDAVLLFWSSHAKASEWVMKECRYAIDKKGLDRLLPVIIEGPPPVTPPPELAELHLNDWLLYLMKSE